MLNVIQNLLPLSFGDNYLLKRISTDDKENLFEIYSNKKIAKYVAKNTHSSIKDTEEFIEEIEMRITKGDNLYLGIYQSKPEKLIGIIRFLLKEDPATLTLGYALNEQYWGQGIVPMALQLLIGYIELEGNFVRLRATVRKENIKSQRTLDKLGFQFSGEFIKGEGNSPEQERLLYYKVLRG